MQVRRVRRGEGGERVFHQSIKKLTPPPLSTQVKSDAYGVQATFSLHNKPVNSLWKFSQVPEVRGGEKREGGGTRGVM